LFGLKCKPSYLLREISKEKIMAGIEFLVEGIVCTGCAMDMENIMLDMEGVEEASVNFSDGVFSITFDPTEIEAKTIIKKVKNLGFKTKILTG
jgi:copper chaperone CopZ